MSIEIQILGRPGEDNATLFRVDSGTSVKRLLFDCGERCLNYLPVSEIQDIDHLFFSHFHMDHVCGFDTFFRHNYNRPKVPVTIWGPPGAIDVIHNRMRGFTWNLHKGQPGKWIVNELDFDGLRSATFFTREAFANAHLDPNWEISDSFLVEPTFSVKEKQLLHGSIPSIGYRVDEPDRENLDAEKLPPLGIEPGPWINQLKDRSVPDDEIFHLGERDWKAGDLREKLLVASSGESAAYLTDFLLEPGKGEWDEIAQWLRGVTTMVCEAQYRESDHQFAKENFHMTTRRVARLAADADVEKLIIQHVSRRYENKEWEEMLGEAREVFPNTEFPENWKVGSQRAQKN